jgi:hypothetical protein
VDRRISPTLGDAVTVGFGGDLCAHGGQGRRAVGSGPVGAACAAGACQRPPSAEEIAGGASRRGDSAGEHTPRRRTAR